MSSPCYSFGAGVVYALDMLVQFHTGFFVTWDLETRVVTDGRQVAKYYVKHGTFVVDALATAPIVMQLALLASNPGDNTALLIKLVGLLKLLRLLRVLRQFNRLSRMSAGGAISNYVVSARKIFAPVPLHSCIRHCLQLRVNPIYIYINKNKKNKKIEAPCSSPPPPPTPHTRARAHSNTITPSPFP